MQRTTIMLPPELKSRALKKAREMGISFAELVREALESRLRVHRNHQPSDPLFADDATFKDEGPDDIGARHDDYLYSVL